MNATKLQTERLQTMKKKTPRSEYLNPRNECLNQDSPFVLSLSLSDNCVLWVVLLLTVTKVGVDATAARSCFLMLKMILRTSAVEVVFSGANRKVQSLLRSHGVIAVHDPVFDR